MWQTGQHHTKQDLRVNFRLIQHGGDVNDETNRVIPSGTLSCQRDVLFMPERECWEMVLGVAQRWVHGRAGRHGGILWPVTAVPWEGEWGAWGRHLRANHH